MTHPENSGGVPPEVGVGREIGSLIRRMEIIGASMEAAGDPKRYFLATYLRTTRAVADELAAGGFLDP